MTEFAIDDWRRYTAMKACAPADDAPMWVVVDRDFEPHERAQSYVSAIRHQRDSSLNTERIYAGRVALYLSYCAANGLDWTSPKPHELAKFLHWLVEAPEAQTVGRQRSKGTANHAITTVLELLRHGALHGWVDAQVVARLSSQRQLRYLPAGFDPGENNERRDVKTKNIKFKVPEAGYEWLTDDEILKVMKRSPHARERFLVALLGETGLRIGEALGLRREDMHLLANSKSLGCREPGPHLHVRRRLNSNGALAKSRYPRVVPVSKALAGLYHDYQWERDERGAMHQSDHVLVNLFREPLGAGMRYSSTKEIFDRLGVRAGFTVRPHMLRHSAATRWIKAGKPLYVVQALLGHASTQSTARYLHADDAEKRAAIDLAPRWESAR